MIDNPDYKGEWTVKRISNPAYKGIWKAKKIANPETWKPSRPWQQHHGPIFGGLTHWTRWKYVVLAGVHVIYAMYMQKNTLKTSIGPIFG